MKPWFRFILAVGLLLVAGTAIAADDTPVGTWKQVDDVSGKVKSIVLITESDGKLQGKVLQLMNLSPKTIARGGHHLICAACSGERKNQPVEGMVVMWGVAKNADSWGGGKILDPNSGKVYKVKLSLKDGGSKLDVHAYVGLSLFGRSQTWERQE